LSKFPALSEKLSDMTSKIEVKVITRSEEVRIKTL